MTTEQKKELSAKNSGKGLSRVEIAQRAVIRLRSELKGAELRLDQAKEAEVAGAENRKAKAAKKEKAAIRALVAIGKTEAEARKMLGLK